MSDANAEFIDALIRLLLEPVIFSLYTISDYRCDSNYYRNP